MQLPDLISLLGMSYPDTQQTTILEKRLSAAIDFASSYCRNDFKDANGQLSIPAGAQMGIALIVKSMAETQNVQSQSLGDMSKSFFEGATGKEAKRYLKPYVKVFK